VTSSSRTSAATTPLAHPILPLISDTNLALVGDPTAIMSNERYREPRDSREQVTRALDVAGFDLYLGLPRATSIRGLAVGGEIIGFDASHPVSWRGTDPASVRGPVALPPIGDGDGLVDAGALPEAEPLDTGFDGTRVEFSIPLGPIEVGDAIRFRLVDRDVGPEGVIAPSEGPGAMVLPDISDVVTAFETVDPEGDDHGPGSYTYPTDPLFTRGLFGDGDRAGWKYAVAVMSQEGFPSSGVRRIRDVETNVGQWRIGGGDGSINGSRIMDLLVPDAGLQESMLTDYVPISTGSFDDLSDDDFAQITPIGNE
jgi:hypothetical protein